MLLTPRTGREDLVEGLNSGADEYLGKPFDRWSRSSPGSACDCRAAASTDRRRDALHRQATRDGPTGLLNRTAIIDACRRNRPAPRAVHPSGVLQPISTTSRSTTPGDTSAMMLRSLPVEWQTFFGHTV